MLGKCTASEEAFGVPQPHPPKNSTTREVLFHHEKEMREYKPQSLCWKATIWLDVERMFACLPSSFCLPKDLVYVTYYMDNNLTNPYLQWKKLGAPAFPSPKQFQKIREAEVWCTGKQLWTLNWSDIHLAMQYSSEDEFRSKPYSIQRSGLMWIGWHRILLTITVRRANQGLYFSCRSDVQRSQISRNFETGEITPKTIFLRITYNPYFPIRPKSFCWFWNINASFKT